MKSKKLVLHRETLRALDSSALRRAGGAALTDACPVETGYTDCVGRCASNPCVSDDSIGCTFTVNTFGVCSGGCGTGGACTT